MARLLAAGASGPGVAHAAPTAPKVWTSPTVIPSAQTDAAPALEEFDGLLYATFNGASWTTSPTTIPSSKPADLGPAIAGYNGSLFVAWDVGEPGPIDYQSGP
jgi:hypothetical protein